MDKILKQSSWLFFAQALGRVIGFFYTIFLARNLGVENFGFYTAALAYFSIISTISDFGINQYFIREVSKDHSLARKLFPNVALLRLTLLSVLFAVFALALYFLDPNKMRVSLSLLAFLAIFPQALALTIDSVFVAIQKLYLSALGLLSLSIATTALGVLFIQSGFDTMGALSALILGELFYFFVMSIILIRTVKLSLNFDNGLIKSIFKESLPYGFLIILGLIYFKVDTILLSYIKGPYDTGIYGAGYKFLEAVIFIPAVLNAALFPFLSKLSHLEDSKLYKLYLKATLFFLFIALIVVVLYLTIIPPLISSLLPAYGSSIEVIKILALSIPFFFMISPQAALLMSQKRFLKPLIWISIFNLCFNLSLNLMFIPKYSFLASAWITVMSDIVGFVIFFLFISFKLLKR